MDLNGKLNGTTKRRKIIRIWNEEIANDLKEKTSNYLIHLQQNTEEPRQAYILNRNKVKIIIRNAQSDFRTNLLEI